MWNKVQVMVAIAVWNEVQVMTSIAMINIFTLAILQELLVLFATFEA